MSDVNEDTAPASTGRPSFGFKPEELEAFRGTGYNLIRLHAPDALDPNGRPIGKAPFRGWRESPALTVDEAKQHIAEGQNVGVRLRPTDLIVDVDPRNFAPGDDPLERIETALDIRFHNWPHVVTGSGGHHYYMTVPEGFLVSDSLENYRGVEFKGYGRQVVAPGSSHPETRQPYLWDEDVLAEPLSAEVRAAPEVLLNLIRRPSGFSGTEPGEYSPEWLGRALELLDPTQYRDQAKWLELMMACHHATAGEGRDEFIAWSTLDPQYARDEWIIGRRWDSLHADGGGKRVTARTLEKHLVEAGVAHLVEPDADRVLADFADDLDDDVPDSIGEQQAKTTVLDRVNADRFTVLTGGKYLVGRERTDPRTGVFSVEWYSPDAIKQHMNAKSIEMPDSKRVPLGDWWLKHPQRRQYDGVVFDPTPGTKHPELYNLWRGWAVEPRKGDWSKMQQLIREVLCQDDQASYDYVVKWMAHMVQHPSQPAEVALVFKGSKGTGKGTLCRALTELAGRHGRHVSAPEHFTGRFNEHLADTILLFVDEGFWAGDKKAEGQIKALITEKTLTFEGKGKPIVTGPNQLHVVMASNEDWVIPATSDERRFAVFEADAAAARTFPHFAALIEDGGAERRRILSAMLHDLLAMDLGDWHPRKDIPQTQALLDQKLEGFRKSPVDAWWYGCLEAGTIPELFDREHWPEAWEADPAAKDLLLQSLRLSRKDAGNVTKTGLAQYLRSVGVNVGDKVRNKQNQKVWAVPSLADARLAFEENIGGAIDWVD